MDTLDDLHTMDSELRSIRLDDGPKLQPLRLDKMFSTATQWEGSSPPTRLVRAPSPPRRRAVFPLPRPISGGGTTSPLGGLFDYPELLPQILSEFHQPKDLVVLARVNRAFCKLARRKLYANIWVRPWEENCHDKLVHLFGSLHTRPELCELVRTLDIRFFALATRGTERYTLDEQVRSAIGCMTNLEHLVWTRDKSLKPQLVERISTLTHLRTLEISGHSERYYDPNLLGRLPDLEDLRIMMPDANFAEALVGILQTLDAKPMGGLRGLAIVCRSSPLVDDIMLKAMAPHLRRLKRLTLWGCTRVTQNGVFEILREAEYLEELSLDGLPHSGLTDLSGSPDLPALQTLSLSFTVPHKTPHRPHLTEDDLPTFPHAPRLQSLLLTLSNDKTPFPPGGLAKLQAQIDFAPMRRLSLLNMCIDPVTLGEILRSSPGLEELYFNARWSGQRAVPECEEFKGSGLRVFHVNAPEGYGPTPDDLLDSAKKMRKLEQVGTGNRVYEVMRRYEGEEHVVELSRWSRTNVPGYFQVWRG